MEPAGTKGIKIPWKSFILFFSFFIKAGLPVSRENRPPYEVRDQYQGQSTYQCLGLFENHLVAAKGYKFLNFYNFNPFLPITVEHLSYLSPVIRI
jgi:hypothetical protein